MAGENQAEAISQVAGKASNQMSGAAASGVDIGMLVLIGVIAVAAIIAISVLYWRCQNPKRTKVIIRTNVLILMCVSYGVVLFVFVALIVFGKDIDPSAAWNILEAPIMALIGGTLAISKDLIEYDRNDEGDENSPDDNGDQPVSEEEEPQ